MARQTQFARDLETANIRRAERFKKLGDELDHANEIHARLAARTGQEIPVPKELRRMREEYLKLSRTHEFLLAETPNRVEAEQRFNDDIQGLISSRQQSERRVSALQNALKVAMQDAVAGRKPISAVDRVREEIELEQEAYTALAEKMEAVSAERQKLFAWGKAVVDSELGPEPGKPATQPQPPRPSATEAREAVAAIRRGDAPPDKFRVGQSTPLRGGL